MTKELPLSQEVTTSHAAEIVRFALKVGEHLEINGGEVSRVEDTVARICRAYGATRVDVFAITSVIIVTAIWHGDVVITQSRRVKGVEKNTARLEAINAVSRAVCSHPMPLDEAKKKLNEALTVGNLTKIRFLIGSLIATVSYAAFFGGDWKDVLVTFGATFMIVLCQFVNNYLGGNRILSNVMCCFFAGLAATALCFWTGASLDMVMAGCIMVLIPGISMTSAVANLILGDTLSGWTGLMEALMTALALAGGFALSQLMIGDLLANSAAAVVSNGTLYKIIQILTSFTGSIGFSLLFGLHGKQLPVAAIGAAMTWGVYLLAALCGCGDFSANVIAAIFAAGYTELFVRVLKVPKTVLTFSVVVSLIPGRALYNTMNHAIKGDFANFAQNGLTALTVAAAIGIGITVVLVAMQFWMKLHRKKRA